MLVQNAVVAKRPCLEGFFKIQRFCAILSIWLCVVFWDILIFNGLFEVTFLGNPRVASDSLHCSSCMSERQVIAIDLYVGSRRRRCFFCWRLTEYSTEPVRYWPVLLALFSAQSQQGYIEKVIATIPTFP